MKPLTIALRLFVLILAILSAAFIYAATTTDTTPAPDLFNPCHLPPEIACIESVRWVSETADTEREAINVLNRQLWKCVTEQQVVPYKNGFLIVGKVPCGTAFP